MLEKTYSESLCDKWSPILEGIDDQYVRESTAVLLENQARHCIVEAQKEGILTEATPGSAPTTVGTIGTFQKFAFPLVRRVFPELIANKIVGVQPMQGPVSQVFYLGYDRASETRLQTIYSKYNLTYGQQAIGDATTQWGDSSYPSGSLDSKAASDLTMTNMVLSGITGASATVGGQIAAFPSATQTVGFDVSSGEVLGTTEIPSGELSSLTTYDPTPYGTIPEINFHIEQQAVTARTRKFRALWTLEAAQDLRAYHNLDLERELTDLLGKEVALEIDRELIEDLRMIAYDISSQGQWNRSLLDMPNSNQITGAGTNTTAFNPSSFLYDFTGASISGQGGGLWQTSQNIFFVDFASTSLNLSPRHVGQAYANLLAALNFAAQDIYKTTYRGAGNWIVTSPMVAAILNSASKLEGGVKAGNWEGQLGANVNYAGKLQGQFDVYVDPLYPEDEILMGYKGSSPMDGGFVYAPYIPLQMLPTITDPETFQPRKGLLTRYGKAVVSVESRFYRVVRLVGAGADFMFKPFKQNTVG
tara:strand:+ start:6556 stop:8148 length:1593 start_codon:yes stop_codon:yes gene_type:complete